MIIIQLDSEQLTSVIKNSVRTVLDERNSVDAIPNDTFLDVNEASKLLRLSKKTLYGLVHRLDIPVNKKGNRLYFSKLDLGEWIRTGRKKTNLEIAIEHHKYKKRSKI